MKHTGFTPGPWVEKTYDKYGTYQVETGDRGFIIAAQIGGIGKANRANAALIADAPALYAENERLLELLGRVETRLVRITARTGAVGGPYSAEVKEADEIGRETLDEIHAALAATKG